MNRYCRIVCLCLIVGTLFSGVSLAQDDTACPVIVQAALMATDDLCSATSRNQICYGNTALAAEPIPDASDFVLEKPGDRAAVANIHTLSLSALDETDQTWGVSLMKLQADLPDTLPGQNVTLLLFGDVAVQPVQPPLVLAATVSAGGTINVRGGASTTAGVVAALASGTTVNVNGRNAAGDWLRAVLDDGGEGWVFAELVAVDGDVDSLAVVQPGQGLFGPMQAFYFRSGIGDAPCAEAPHSGILIHTPRGAGKIHFLVNAVHITLGSTAFLQAETGDSLTISVVEGLATVEAFGETQAVPAGAQIVIPIDADLAASGPPETVMPYSEETVQSLPVSLLDDAITVAAPLAADAIEAAVSEVATCTLTSATTVNTRSGPSTAYPVSGTLAAGEVVYPVGQLMSIDGYRWWQISEGAWARTDVVEPAGACDSLPIVTDIPPIPTPQPTTFPVATTIPVPTTVPESPQSVENQPTYDSEVQFDILRCRVHLASPPLHAGQRVLFFHGRGDWPSPEEAEAALAGHEVRIIIDGIQIPTSYYQTVLTELGYSKNGVAIWMAYAGEHTAYAEYTGVDSTGTCSFTVVD